MSEELYLILHKVRGEPAFDIAQKMMFGKEEGWIIPTSGHRAYPLDWWKMNDLSDSQDEHIPQNTMDNAVSHEYWPDLPDHYDAKRDDNSYMEDEARTILMRRGLLKAKSVNNYRRR